MKQSHYKMKGNANHPKAAQDLPVNSLNPAAMRDEIQALAYHLWIERGCPVGSPEVDWFEAEEQVLTAGPATMTAA